MYIIPTMRGVLKRAKLPVEFIGAGKSASSGASGPLVLPGTAAVGDMLAVSGSVSGGSWTSRSNIVFTFLNATNMVPNYFTLSGHCTWVVYRNASDLIYKSSNSANGDVTVPGFVKSSQCKAVLLTGYNPLTGSYPTTQLPFVNRGTGSMDSGAAYCIGDIINPDDYVNNSSAVMSSSSGFGSISNAYLYEVI